MIDFKWIKPVTGQPLDLRTTATRLLFFERVIAWKGGPEHSARYDAPNAINASPRPTLA